MAERLDADPALAATIARFRAEALSVRVMEDVVEVTNDGREVSPMPRSSPSSSRRTSSGSSTSGVASVGAVTDSNVPMLGSLDTVPDTFNVCGLPRVGSGESVEGLAVAAPTGVVPVVGAPLGGLPEGLGGGPAGGSACVPDTPPSKRKRIVRIRDDLELCPAVPAVAPRRVLFPVSGPSALPSVAEVSPRKTSAVPPVVRDPSRD